LARARPVDLRSGVGSSLDFQLEVVPAFKVSGVVSGPKGGAFVAVRLTSTTEPSMMQFSQGPQLGSETAIAITDARGAFTMLGVPAGKYVLFVRLRPDDPTVTWEERRTMGTAQSARSELSIESIDVKDVALTLRTTPTITGQIVFAGDPLPTSADIRAMRFGLYEDFLSSIPKPVTPLIRPDGSFQFSGIVPGRYWPVASLGEWGIHHINIDGRSFDNRPIVLDNEGLTDVRIVATHWRSQAAIYGTVRLPPGMSPDEVTVAVFPGDYSQRIADGNLSSRRVRFLRLRNAQFNHAFLPAGSYYVVAYREADGADPTNEFFERLALGAQLVTLAEAELKPVTLAVPTRPVF
jgi:hypothetical protein